MKEIAEGSKAELEEEWKQTEAKVRRLIGKPIDLNGMLFLIGVQELGKGTVDFTKEEKQDLMHLGTCRVLSSSGYYELEGLDDEGWPHWKASRPLPNMKLQDQEDLLRWHVIDYFEEAFG